jgi:hypothetical protein
VHLDPFLAPRKLVIPYHSTVMVLTRHQFVRYLLPPPLGAKEPAVRGVQASAMRTHFRSPISERQRRHWTTMKKTTPCLLHHLLLRLVKGLQRRIQMPMSYAPACHWPQDHCRPIRYSCKRSASVETGLTIAALVSIRTVLLPTPTVQAGIYPYHQRLILESPTLAQ